VAGWSLEVKWETPPKETWSEGREVEGNPSKANDDREKREKGGHGKVFSVKNCGGKGFDNRRARKEDL